MNPRTSVRAAVALLALTSTAAFAEESTFKEGAKEVGHAVGTAAHDVGKEAKKVGKAVGEAAKEGVEAVKEGGKEFKKAVKGES
jgi:hypothetical protein